MNPSVITLGEILADFVPEGKGYVLCPGGAPSNVAINLSRMGIRSGMIGRVGGDFLGRFLLSFVKNNGVDVSNVKPTPGRKNGLVFVFLDRNGERDFTFYGTPSADTFLSPSDIKGSYIKKCSVLHFGSISMMAPLSKAATLRAIKIAKKNKKLVSYDPNVRLNLWQGRHAQARREIRGYFKYADIIKISDTEFRFLFGTGHSVAAVKKYFGRSKLVFVSCGKNGCVVYRGGFSSKIPGFKVKPVDTTGAGDAFMAGVLAGIVKAGKGIELSKKELVKTGVLANKMGARAVTRKGAV